jgi:hypothetical protein
MNLTWLTKEEVDEAVMNKCLQTNVVLDIGSGICPQYFVKPNVHICVEPYLPYIEKLQQSGVDESRYVFLNCAWDGAMKILPDKSVDSVFALDVIEHMEKEDGLKFLKEAERVARQQIMIYTPLGFYPQTYDDPDKSDRWGMGGGYWQTHRSGWSPEDFGEGWELICCKEYHFIDEDEQLLEKPFGAIWAFRNFGETLQEARKIDSLEGIATDELALALWRRTTGKVKRTLNHFKVNKLSKNVDEIV